MNRSINVKTKTRHKDILGLPYSDKDPKVMQFRFEAANKVAAVLMKQGHIVFSPISHSHPMAVQCDMPGDYEYWKAWSRSFLEWSDCFIALTLPGYKDSTGLNSELDVMSILGKPVITVDPYAEPFNLGK